MSKSKKTDINQLLLKAHKLSVKNAIEKSAQTGTPLVVYQDGKVKQIKPSIKYVRISVETSKKKHSLNKRSSNQKK